jgi:predicted kinase
MLSLLEEHVTAGSRLVIVDAVHGESAKRKAVFDLCAAHDADPLLLWCRCDDRSEIER